MDTPAGITYDQRFQLLSERISALGEVVADTIEAAYTLEDEPQELTAGEVGQIDRDLMALVLGYLEHAKGTGAIEVLGDGGTENTVLAPATRYNRVAHALAPSDSDVCICDGCLDTVLEDQIKEAESLVDDARAQLDDAIAHLNAVSDPANSPVFDRVKKNKE